MPALSGHFIHTCDIGTTSDTVDAAGAPVKTQVVSQTSVPCRFMYDEGLAQEMGDSQMGRTQKTDATLFLGTDVTVDREDTISNVKVANDGTVFDAGSYRVIRKRTRSGRRKHHVSLTLQKVI